MTVVAAAAALAATCATARNPIIRGWYADPELHLIGKRYWIYPTFSASTGKAEQSHSLTPLQRKLRTRKTVYPSYRQQTFLDAFSSPDLVHWTRHRHVLDVHDVKWAAYAVWAPSMIEQAGRYYLFFGANDIQSDRELGGIGVAVAASPAGPFRDLIGKPLIDAFHNGAQPIDPFVFRDDDGRVYLYFGGWKHCNVAMLAPDLKSVTQLSDGEQFKEITPEGYVEGPFVIKRHGFYYLMWSEGDWTGPDYQVAYAIGKSPAGPFRRMGTILKQDPTIARGAGHHSVLNLPGTDDWYIAYHRRPPGTVDGDHRELAIEHLYFDKIGAIRPVKMTRSGVEALAP